MKVLYAPHFETNTYQRLLTESVAANGIEPVLGHNALILPLTRQVIRDDIDLVHLIWTNPFFIVKPIGNARILEGLSKVGTVGRAVLFIIDLLILKLLGIGIVWTVHNKHNHERHHIRVDHSVSRILGRLADTMTVECETAQETISEIFHISREDQIRVIPEGNYIDAYPSDRDGTRVRETFSIDSNAFLYLFFGQIRKYKDVPGLISAFEDVEAPNAKLLIAGNPKTKRLENEVRDAIEAVDTVEAELSFIPDNEIQDYMHAADVVVLPYRDIITSGSVLLAMSFGRAVIAPQLGCIPTLINGSKALQYDPESTNGLTESMEWAFNHKETIDAIGQANYERASELSWNEIGKVTVEVYEAVMEQQSLGVNISA